MQSFYDNKGESRVTSMMNFTISEFFVPWGEEISELFVSFNVGRGTRCEQIPEDLFYMLFVVLYIGRTWKFHAAIFKMNLSTFKRNITSIMEPGDPLLFQLYVTEVPATRNNGHINEDNVSFMTFPSARYTKDVCFQLSYHPIGRHYKLKPWLGESTIYKTIN